MFFRLIGTLAEHEDEIRLWLDKVRVLFLPIMVYVVIIQSKFLTDWTHLKKSSFFFIKNGIS